MIRVQQQPFDAGQELAALKAGRTKIGGTVMFLGTVRDISDGSDIRAMTLEHYPGMTERALQEIEAEALRRWPLVAALIIHRYGRLEPGEDIVLVITASAHREAAFDACHAALGRTGGRGHFSAACAKVPWRHAMAPPELLAEVGQRRETAGLRNLRDGFGALDQAQGRPAAARVVHVSGEALADLAPKEAPEGRWADMRHGGSVFDSQFVGQVRFDPAEHAVDALGAGAGPEGGRRCGRPVCRQRAQVRCAGQQAAQHLDEDRHPALG